MRKQSLFFPHVRREIPPKNLPSSMRKEKLKKKISLSEKWKKNLFSFFKKSLILLILVDWLIDLFIRRYGTEYAGPMRVYLLVFTYRKTLQRKKNSYLLSLIDCLSRLFRSSFDIDSMSFFICCSLISWYVLLLIADWMKMFMNYCELN